MKSASMVLMVFLLVGSLAACGDKPASQRAVAESDVAHAVAEAKKDNISVSPDELNKTLGKKGCQLVFAHGIGQADPHVIVAGDNTVANDAARYFNGLPAKDRKAIEDAVRARAWQSFVCVGSCSAKQPCTKQVRISYGSGHLPKLNKDVYIIQSERSCSCS